MCNCDAIAAASWPCPACLALLPLNDAAGRNE
jgi:hypothetical protein